ncbi:MAG: hypothetical protein ACOCX4_09740, partial [Planctomycetota bacterium]
TTREQIPGEHFRRGDRLRWYLDGKLLFDYTDPHLLTGDRIALWTEHRGIMVSRARISYAQAAGREDPVIPAAAADAPLPERDPKQDAPPLTWPDHIGYAADFETGNDGWGPTGRENSATPRRVARGGGGHALRMTNEISGGDAGVLCRLPRSVDLLRHPWLSFACQADPDARINLYVCWRDEWFALRLTGHAEDNASDLYPGAPTKPGEGTKLIRVIGSVKDFRADGSWHRYRVNIGDALLARAPELVADPPNALFVDELFVGNLEVGDLAQSGFGSNHEGTRYSLDAIRLEAHPPETPLPPPQVTAAGTVDAAGWATARVETAPGAPWIVPEALTLRHGATVRSGTEALQNGWIRPDPAGGRLHVALSRLGARADEEGGIPLRLDDIRMRGRTETTSADLRWLLQDAEQARPVGFAVDVEADQPIEGVTADGWKPGMLRESFAAPAPAASNGQWLRAWDATGGPEGRGSLRFVAQRAAANMICESFFPRLDVARFPLIDFAYRADIGTRADLQLLVGGRPMTLAFLNGGAGAPSVTDKVEALDDGAWHRAAIAIGPLYCRSQATGTGTEAARIGLQDFGWPGNTDGVELRIGQVGAYPLLRTGADGSLRLRLRAYAPVALEGLRYELVRFGAPSPLPGEDWSSKALETITSLEGAGQGAVVTLHPPGPGTYTLCWAMRGPAGWTDAPPYHFAVDATGPVIASIAPDDGARDAPQRIRCILTDEGLGIRPGSVELTVNGRTLEGRETPPLQYAPVPGEVRLDLVDLARKEAGSFADNGEAIAVRLRAEDLAGQPVERSWTWTMDYAKDKTPPPEPDLTWVPTAAYWQSEVTWKDPVGRLEPVKDEARLRLVQDEVRKRKVLEIGALHHNRSAAFAFRTEPIDLRSGLRLRFDYRFRGQLLGDLRVHVGGRVYVLRFSDKINHGAKVVGVLAKPQYEGQWHTVDADIAGQVLPNLPEGTPPTVTRIEWGTPGRTGNHHQHWLRLDHVSLYAPKHLEQGIELRWSAVRDPTGVLVAPGVDADATTE